MDSVYRDCTRCLSKSTALSGSETLFLLSQFRFELFDQLCHQSLKFRLTPSECRFVPDRLVAHAQIGQHQLKGVDSGVAVQGFSLRARRGYDTAALTVMTSPSDFGGHPVYGQAETLSRSQMQSRPIKKATFTSPESSSPREWASFITSSTTR